MKELEIKNDIVKIEEGKITFTDFKTIKSRAINIVNQYSVLELTDDNIQELKKARTDFNKYKKDLNSRRIEIKKKWSEPLATFENEVKEIDEILDIGSQKLDVQVKEFELKQKEEKKIKIEQTIKDLISLANKELAELEITTEIAEEMVIFDEKWLNATVTMTKVSEAIQAQVDKELAFQKQYSSDLKVIATLEPELSVLAKTEYVNNGHNLPEAMETANKVLREQKEAKAKLAAEQELKGISKVTEEEQAQIAEEHKNSILENEPVTPTEKIIPANLWAATFKIIGEENDVKVVYHQITELCKKQNVDIERIEKGNSEEQ